MFLFAHLISCLKPVILVPGHGGSGAWATLTNYELYKDDCPAFLAEGPYKFWPMNETFAKSYPKCMGHLIRAVYDQATNSIVHPDGIKFELEEWGKMDSLYNYVDLVRFLVDKGYTKGKDLFGIPYDWVLYFPGTEKLFTDLISFIEKIVSETKQKVIIMGHSMGTHVVRLLLTKKTTEQWVKDHIDGVELLAPAFYGCFVSFNMVVQGKFGAIPVNDVVAKSARQMPSLHVLWDNYVVFDNHPVFREVDGKPEGIRPNEVKDYLVSIGRFDQDAQKIFSFVEPTLAEAPIEPPVRSYILYNGGISTPVSLNASTEDYTFINGTGDAVCHDGGPKYCCEHWKNTKCFNWNKDDWLYSHSQMMYRDPTLEKIYEFIGNSVEPSDDKFNYTPIIIGCVVGGIVIIAIVILVLFCITRRQKMHDGFQAR